MSANPILYLGDDIFRRVPALEGAGIVVVRSECSVPSLRRCFGEWGTFSIVAFHNDLHPPADEVVKTARELSRAPLVLFKNPVVKYDDWLFDLVIEVPAPPEVWTKTLGEAVAEAGKQRELSQQLRQDRADDVSRTPRETAIGDSVLPFDTLLRSKADGEPEESDDEGGDS